MFTHKFNTILIKTPIDIWQQLDKLILESHANSNKQDHQEIQEQKSNEGTLPYQILKYILRTSVIGTMVLIHRDITRSRMESLEIYASISYMIEKIIPNQWDLYGVGTQSSHLGNTFLVMKSKHLF